MAGSLVIHQDVRIHAAVLAPGETLEHGIAPQRRIYVHVARGSVTLNGQALDAGDAAMLSGEKALGVAAAAQAELLLFDLA